MSRSLGGAGMTGFAASVVHSIRSADPVATQGSSMPSCRPEYTSVGTPPSSTSTPDQQPSASGPSPGSSAIGRCSQCTRSALRE